MNDASHFALVTGATRGLGKAFATELARRGRNLILAARSADDLASVAESLRDGKIRVECVAADLSADNGPETLFTAIAANRRHIDLLINNAGFGLRGEFQKLPLARQIELMKLNVLAPMQLTYKLLPDLLAARGAIINVSSMAGFQPIPFAAAYSASKAALNAFSQSLAEELHNSGVRVVTLCPGRILPAAARNADGSIKEGYSRVIYQTPEEIALAALDALDRPRGPIVPGVVNNITLFVQRGLPRSVIPKLVARLSKT